MVLVMTLACLVFLVASGTREISIWVQKIREDPIGMNILPLLAFSPVFVALLSTPRFSFYEEVQAYSFLLGVALLSSVIYFIRNSTMWAFALIATVAGFAAFVRPTAGIYGVASFAVIFAQACLLRWSQGRLLTGLALFLFGGFCLLIVNWIRFGAAFEFGHNLHLNNFPTMRFAGRFEAPFESEPLFSAARELITLLFLDEGYISETVRWRQLYFPNYNLAYTCPLLFVAGWFAVRCWRMIRSQEVSFGVAEVLAFWFLACTIPLLAFYLRFPFINSRYLVDFAPGFGAGLLAFLYLLSGLSVGRFMRQFRWSVTIVVFLWWGYQLIFATGNRIGSPVDPPIAREDLLRKIDQDPSLFLEAPEEYTLGMAFEKYVSYFSGSGWSSESGKTRAAIALFVDDPEFVELTVTFAEGFELSRKDYETIQAKVALEFLNLESMTPTQEGMVLRFSGPRRKRYQSGIQVAFIAFMTAEELHEGWSRFRLLRVRWRDEG